MNFLLFFSLFLNIFCSEHVSENISSKIDFDALNFKSIETKDEIIITIKSNEYLPLKGKWRSGKTSFYLDQFFIDDTGIFKWFCENIINRNKAKLLISNISKYTFEYKIRKDELEGKDDLVLRLKLLKKTSLEEILRIFVNPVYLPKSLDYAGKVYLLSLVIDLMDLNEIDFDVKFVCRPGEPPMFVRDKSEIKKEAVTKETS